MLPKNRLVLEKGFSPECAALLPAARCPLPAAQQITQVKIK